MSSLTLEKLQEDIIDLKKEIRYLHNIIKEDYKLADDVIADIEESKSRNPKELISNEEMRKEFA